MTHAGNYPFENLILSGGGIWGLTYAGAAQVLAEEDIFIGIRRIAGVSSGAIFATAICLGYSPDDIVRIVHETNFGSFEDKPNLLRIFLRYGLFAGDAVLAWLHELVARSPLGAGNPNLTFQELSERSSRELYVFATDLNTQTFQEFSSRTRPHFRVADAVRASISLPLLFKAWRFAPEFNDHHIYCDGGMMNNYPINFFDDPCFLEAGCIVNQKTLGFMFLPPPTNASRPNDGLVFGELHRYLMVLLESIIIGAMGSIQSSANLVRTVFVPVHDTGISPTHFEISREDVDILIQVGRQALLVYLAEYRARLAADPLTASA